MKSKKFSLLLFLFISVCIVSSVILASCKIFNNFDLVSGSNKNAENIVDDKSAQKEAVEEKIEIEEEVEEIPMKLWIDSSIPSYLRDVIKQESKKMFDKLVFTDNKDSSDVRIEIGFADKSSTFFWVFAPVVSFFRYCDDMSWQDLKEFWNGSEDSLSYITNQDMKPELIVTEENLSVLEKFLGKCKNENIKIVAKEDFLSKIEGNKSSFSIIPFEEIVPKLKVLNLEGMSIFDKNLNVLKYPLTLSINVKGRDPDLVDELKCSLGEVLATNRDIEKLATVNMTGVTAPAQGKTIGNMMNKYGALYPAEKIAGVLRDTDITHISNEIPFMEGCTGKRYIETGDCVFCCKPEYIELLRYVGTDVVELTGNHMNDFGSEWMLYTLDMYDKEGWPYFGGGRNLEDSYKPALFEVNGNRIAFLGCNYFGPDYNWATEDNPGSARINMWNEVQMEEDFQRVEGIVKELKQDGYIVIFTFQYVETYNYRPTEQQIIDFRRIIDAGADIVSGSQSHQPMGVEFRGNGFINYGLGNLFFNQADELAKKQGIIAKHIFYDGKYINTVLITTMLENLSQPRVTTSEERVELLKSIFSGSIR